MKSLKLSVNKYFIDHNIDTIRINVIPLAVDTTTICTGLVFIQYIGFPISGRYALLDTNSIIFQTGDKTKNKNNLKNYLNNTTKKINRKHKKKMKEKFLKREGLRSIYGITN